MAQTAETIPPEKQVRIKFDQSGPSRVVKLTPTAAEALEIQNNCRGN